MKKKWAVGEKVTYVPTVGAFENGIIKSIQNDNYLFVVYHCGDDWDNYQNYTAAKTHIDFLVRGWRV